MRLVNQDQELSTFVGQTTVKALRDTATVIIVSSYLIYKNVYLFSIALIVIPVIAFLMIAVVKRVRKMQALAETAIGKFISNIDEMKTGMRTTKMAAQEEADLNVYQNQQNQLEHTLTNLCERMHLPHQYRSIFSIRLHAVVGGGVTWLFPINLIWTEPQ